MSRKQRLLKRLSYKCVAGTADDKRKLVALMPVTFRKNLLIFSISAKTFEDKLFTDMIFILTKGYYVNLKTQVETVCPCLPPNVSVGEGISSINSKSLK